MSSPNEWVVTTLDFAGAWGSGGTPKKSESSYYGGDLPWLVIGDLNDDVVSKASSSITLAGLESCSAKLIPPGTVLIAMYGSIGKMGLTAIKCATNQAIAFCSPHKNKIDTKYLFYYLRSQRDKLLAQGKGGAQQNISQTVLKAYKFLLPSLAEQKVIVAKLDGILAQVDTIKAHLDATPVILKRFRQSVLAEAVSGKLTKEWREMHCPTQDLEQLRAKKDELIQAKKVKKDLTFSQASVWFEIPTEWGFVELQSLAIKITDGEHKTPKREPAGRYLLSARNVRDGTIDLSNVDYVGDKEFEKLRKRCDPDINDVLLSCSGSVGRVALVDKNDEYVMVRSAALIKTLPDFIDNLYLMSVLQSPYLQKQILDKSKSTAQSNLFLGQIKELGIPLPTTSEQSEIVRRIGQLFAFAEQIEQRVKVAQMQVNQLTQSILAKAFRGDLTAEWREQNPDLISGENSAEALLEKIKAERTSAELKKRRHKT